MTEARILMESIQKLSAAKHAEHLDSQTRQGKRRRSVLLTGNEKVIRPGTSATMAASMMSNGKPGSSVDDRVDSAGVTDHTHDIHRMNSNIVDCFQIYVFFGGETDPKPNSVHHARRALDCSCQTCFLSK